MQESREQEHLRASRRKVWQAWVVALPLMAWMVWHMVAGGGGGQHGMEPGAGMGVWAEWLVTLAAAFVLFVPGGGTLRSAWRSTLTGLPNMDVLISIGCLASWTTGLVAVAAASGAPVPSVPSFAGVATMIMAFHLTGRYVEDRARGSASQAIRRLMDLSPAQATRIRNGVAEQVAVSELRRGDVVQVRPGEAFPADGEVVDGRGSVDEALVTGESVPVTRGPGDAVVGGTVNLDGGLRVVLTGVGSDTFLQKVVRLVEQAQQGKVPVQQLADRVVAVFVPALLVVAAATFVLWMAVPAWETLSAGLRPWFTWAGSTVFESRFEAAFFSTLAVLVIACPCALGLATPVALMAGIGRGARGGVLFRKGAAIQRLSEAAVVVFDKTGTLTTGRLTVTSMEPAPSVSAADREWWVRAAAVESLSEHPVASAIVRHARQALGAEDARIRDVQVEAFSAVPGQGVRARVDGAEHRIGTWAFACAPEGVAVPDSGSVQSAPAGSDPVQTHLHQGAGAEPERAGEIRVYASCDGRWAGTFTLADSVKPDSARVVRSLHDRGMRTMLLSGDHPSVARRLAQQVGIEEVKGGLLPQDKEREVRAIREREAARGAGAVVMVGDGVNDAPALARADVGVALGTGTDVAMESADVVLTQGGMEQVLRAVDLAKGTFARIRQNLFWAFAYNLVMVPLAMLGLLHPILAELAMAMSSLTVIANAVVFGRGKPSG